MSTFPSITGSQLIKALRKLGFEVIRTRGSHHFLRHPDGRTRLYPYTKVRRSGVDSLLKSSETVSSHATTSEKYFKRTIVLDATIEKVHPYYRC